MKNPAPARRRAKWLAVALIMTPLLLTLVWAMFERLTTERISEAPVPELVIGGPAPPFEYPRLAGGRTSLADHRGKLVLINVWATWCIPCLEEMPALQRLYTTLRSEGVPFEILAVSIDALGADAVRRFVDRFGLTFPILIDPRGSVKKLYRTTGVPETFLVAPGGRLLQKIIGTREWDAPDAVAYLKRMARHPG